MFLEVTSIVKTNVEHSIKRLSNDSIKILNLVIPKPDIPRDIAANYKAVKVQWTEQLVATQQQKTEKIKKETQSIKALLDAEREKDVLEIGKICIMHFTRYRGFEEFPIMEKLEFLFNPDIVNFP